MKIDSDDRCLACSVGQLQERRIDYSITAADGVKVVVQNLLVEVCDNCGEVVLSADAAGLVDAAIAEQTEQLTPQEIEQIRDAFGVDQTEMSEIVGLGGKTYHRWEKGNQVPSRSMGYYLRVLAEYPDAFTWLRDRGWRQRNRLAAAPSRFDFGTAFPDLAAIPSTPTVPEVPRFMPTKALFGKTT